MEWLLNCAIAYLGSCPQLAHIGHMNYIDALQSIPIQVGSVNNTNTRYNGDKLIHSHQFERKDIYSCPQKLLFPQWNNTSYENIQPALFVYPMLGTPKSRVVDNRRKLAGNEVKRTKYVHLFSGKLWCPIKYVNETFLQR